MHQRPKEPDRTQNQSGETNSSLEKQAEACDNQHTSMNIGQGRPRRKLRGYGRPFHDEISITEADRAERNHGEAYKQAAQSNRDWHREPLFIPISQTRANRPKIKNIGFISVWVLAL